ncbi:MAG: amino acid adenylation domain-containing protein [Gemmatimonadota bacterium]
MTDTLHGLLGRAAGTHPDRIAIEEPGERTTDYRRLDSDSDRLSEALVREGVRPGDRVGLCTHKSIDAVVSIFGILKAGAAYVPVDAGAPPERNAYIFQDCSVAALIVERAALAALEAVGEEGTLRVVEEFGDDHLVVLPERQANESPADSQPVPAGLAYILYTSGSTGRPKGVMHTHESALSFVDWCSDVFEPLPADRFSSHAPFHFDLSILDLYVPIKHGARIVLIGEDLGKHPTALARAIARSGIAVWYSTPSVLRLLLEFGRMEQYDYSALRYVLFAGEVFPVKHLRALKARWPAARYFNLYGPTETNVCTCMEIPSEIADDRSDPFPIGTVCSGDRIRVVDRDGKDVRQGEEGELWVVGGSVMRGYWNLPERNKLAFDIDEEGTRWYRTGDVVREEDDGNLLFVGRRDRMVKRRGYRVELGEIEAALYRHRRVSEAAVIASPDEESGVRLKAFLCLSNGERPSLIELKQFCARHLPLYMIPDSFSFPDALPRTSTDKVDYRKLQNLA